VSLPQVSVMNLPLFPECCDESRGLLSPPTCTLLPKDANTITLVSLRGNERSIIRGIGASRPRTGAQRSRLRGGASRLGIPYTLYNNPTRTDFSTPKRVMRWHTVRAGLSEPHRRWVDRAWLRRSEEVTAISEGSVMRSGDGDGDDPIFPSDPPPQVKSHPHATTCISSEGGRESQPRKVPTWAEEKPTAVAS